MRALTAMAVTMPLLLLAACESDVISLGARRCEGTRCEPAAASEAFPRFSLIEEQAEGSAQLLWRAPISCDAPSDVPCGSYQASDGPHASSDDWAAQWFVAADGAVVEARIVQTAIAPGDAETPRLLQLRKLAADGSTLWEHVDKELLARLFPPAPLQPALRMAFAPDGDDGAALLALGTFETERAQHVFALDADGTLTPVFAVAHGGAPQRLAVSGDRILVLGSYDGAAELAAYQRDGALLWRQTELYDRTAGRLLAPAPRPLVLAAGDLAHVLLRLEYAYEWVAVDRDGAASDWLRLGSAPPHPEPANSALTVDSRGRLIAAMDSADAEYRLVRCQQADCDEASLLSTGGRQQQNYYPPELLGMSVDQQGRIYVATHDGALMKRRLVIDLISADFAERRAFVVEGEGASELYPQAIVAGTQGDVYYWSANEIGRIALAP